MKTSTLEVKSEEESIEGLSIKKEEPKFYKCDHCGERKYGIPTRSDILSGEYCDRDCFLTELYSED